MKYLIRLTIILVVVQIAISFFSAAKIVSLSHKYQQNLNLLEDLRQHNQQYNISYYSNTSIDSIYQHGQSDYQITKTFDLDL